jgi:methyl-accepting chemotaxis protein
MGEQMIRFFRERLLGRMMALLFAVSVLPILGFGFVVSYEVEGTLVEAAYERLNGTTEAQRQALLSYFGERVAAVKVLAGSLAMHGLADELFDYHERTLAKDDGPLVTDTQDFKELLGRADASLKSYVSGLGFHNVALICARHGHIMYSFEKASDLGTNLVHGPYRDSPMADLWRRVKESGKPQMVDMAWYEPHGEKVLFVGAPLVDASGQVEAVVVGQFDNDHVEEVVANTTGLGKTGHIYLIGENRTLRSRIGSSESVKLLETVVDTTAAKSAVEHGQGVAQDVDFEGHAALVAYRHLGLDDEFGADFEWFLIGELETVEALASTYALRWLILGITLALAVSALLLAFFTARGLANPVTRITEVVAKVAEGDLTQRVPPLKRKDEIGVLGVQFNSMVESLAAQTHEMTQGIQVIASASSEITATSQQLAASSSQTASAVSETTVTVEEVKQTAVVATQKSQLVAESARATAETAAVGSMAVEQTIARMEGIRVQMETIAESVVRLSEQSQAIGEIISAVDDLAEQSNLLAVNASIEAAKAGEHGKGFAVVAQEVKSLAEQSKEATSQVRTILSDVQKATSAAVMATEQGAKAVEAGADQSRQAGEAIETLGRSIQEAAQAASQIAASSQQQLAGVEQVTEAMEGIKDATEQNVEGTRQLEGAVVNLSDLGQRLKALVEHYRF